MFLLVDAAPLPCWVRCRTTALVDAQHRPVQVYICLTGTQHS